MKYLLFSPDIQDAPWVGDRGQTNYMKKNGHHPDNSLTHKETQLQCRDHWSLLSRQQPSPATKPLYLSGQPVTTVMTVTGYRNEPRAIILLTDAIDYWTFSCHISKRGMIM